MRSILLSLLLLLPATLLASTHKGKAMASTPDIHNICAYVDPRIGSEGEGRVVIGPSCPFGMVKPSPDCTARHNSGWAPMPEQVDGFSQTHVSGTGGGPKYGNILIQPYLGTSTQRSHPQYRESEVMELGYYHCRYDNGIGIEVTTAPRASIYRIAYPESTSDSDTQSPLGDQSHRLMVDAGWFLGENPVPDARETQQFVASEIEVKNSRELSGFTRIRGGWNNGRAYTVYFWLMADRDFESCQVQVTDGRAFAPLQLVPKGTADAKASAPKGVAKCDTLILKIGISFVSERQARQNAVTGIQGFDFDHTLQACTDQWAALLGRIDIDPCASDTDRRMFYTGLYHTMLEPVDRTGENPLWTDYQDFDPSRGLIPYYDDFYAIWDTYRSSSPLITLIDPQRQADIVRSLINIGKRDGYMPDARSGNANGRTQGGSNAEIVLADAFVKGLGNDPEHPIDWEEGLHEMLKDATLPPGGNQEAEGRGGLTEYLRLGYVPYGIDRSGNRTMEYATCDYAIAEVAHGLGRETLAEQYLQQSQCWKNLWRTDYEHCGTRGFIMPRDAQGQWLDTLTMGHSRQLQPTFVYTPVTNESPWYQAWWGTVFYEATSWEYSLSVPQDVPSLIELCGGREPFEQRLDTFFDRGFYNVNNEPSFLTPCLYHWIGRPDRTSDRVTEIIDAHFNDGHVGLPGNDDSGSMSSWLAFHMMGFYPNAGTDYYVLHTPRLRSTTLHLPSGQDFVITAPKLSARNRYIVGAKLNGQDYPYAYLRHSDIIAGGTLELLMGPKPGTWGTQSAMPQGYCSTPGQWHKAAAQSNTVPVTGTQGIEGEYIIDFDLRTQHRVFTMQFEPAADGGLLCHWALPRNGNKMGAYRMTAASRQHAQRLCYLMPSPNDTLICPDSELFILLSADALQQLKADGHCHYNNSELTMADVSDADMQASNKADTQASNTTEPHLLHAINYDEGYEIWVLDDPTFPLIYRMKNNPVEVDWMVVEK